METPSYFSAIFTHENDFNGFLFASLGGVALPTVVYSTPRKKILSFNPLYTGRLFHCYMLNICHFRGIRSILSLLFYYRWKILLANTIDPDQMPHYVVSDLGLHCFGFDPLTGFQVRIG